MHVERNRRGPCENAHSDSEVGGGGEPAFLTSCRAEAGPSAETCVTPICRLSADKDVLSPEGQRGGPGGEGEQEPRGQELAVSGSDEGSLGRGLLQVTEFPRKRTDRSRGVGQELIRLPPRARVCPPRDPPPRVLCFRWEPCAVVGRRGGSDTGTSACSPVGERVPGCYRALGNFGERR